ncbi:hypothetical protein GQ43DRAFT_472947 [Delitschia confertaspora ATCC 74209]|uniref:Uncharacterized protein n=1 Tax=Delitschia confertaspora ATCC 74209 TaxID=1513339 RepID=A0A9P4JJ91_9PLEO|nr:hypothetical protein GQ43DRAFT_472947 [Delitschia confertaspora ATCC 74209]
MSLTAKEEKSTEKFRIYPAQNQIVESVISILNESAASEESNTAELPRIAVRKKLLTEENCPKGHDVAQFLCTEPTEDYVARSLVRISQKNNEDDNSNRHEGKCGDQSEEDNVSNEYGPFYEYDGDEEDGGEDMVEEYDDSDGDQEDGSDADEDDSLDQNEEDNDSKYMEEDPNSASETFLGNNPDVKIILGRNCGPEVSAASKNAPKSMPSFVNDGFVWKDMHVSRPFHKDFDTESTTPDKSGPGAMRIFQPAEEKAQAPAEEGTAGAFQSEGKGTEAPTEKFATTPSEIIKDINETLKTHTLTDHLYDKYKNLTEASQSFEARRKELHSVADAHQQMAEHFHGRCQKLNSKVLVSMVEAQNALKEATHLTESMHNEMLRNDVAEILEDLNLEENYVRIHIKALSILCELVVDALTSNGESHEIENEVSGRSSTSTKPPQHVRLGPDEHHLLIHSRALSDLLRIVGTGKNMTRGEKDNLQEAHQNTVAEKEPSTGHLALHNEDQCANITSSPFKYSMSLRKRPYTPWLIAGTVAFAGLTIARGVDSEGFVAFKLALSKAFEESGLTGIRKVIEHDGLKGDINKGLEQIMRWWKSDWPYVLQGHSQFV